MPSAGLYIHIPFCNIKCIYCDFYSVVDQEKTIPNFFKALFKEIQSINKHKNLDRLWNMGLDSICISFDFRKVHVIRRP